MTLQFNGKKLDKKDFFGKSDPFLVFYRCNEDNRLVKIHINYYHWVPRSYVRPLLHCDLAALF